MRKIAKIILGLVYLYWGAFLVNAQIPIEEPKDPLPSQDDLTGIASPCGIDISLHRGFPPYTYQWSNGATTEDINDYTVIVTDALCGQATKTFTVPNSNLFISGTKVDIAVPCRTGSIDLTVSTIAGTAYPPV